MSEVELVPCPRVAYPPAGFVRNNAGDHWCCVCHGALPEHVRVPAAYVVEYSLLGLDIKHIRPIPSGWHRKVARLRMSYGLETRSYYESVRMSYGLNK